MGHFVWDIQNFDFYGCYNLHVIYDIYFPLSNIRVGNRVNANVINFILQCYIELRIISRGIGAQRFVGSEDAQC